MTAQTPGDRPRRPTIDAGTGRRRVEGCVSFAFNGRPGVSEETRRRIVDIADEMGWRPRASARALSVGKAMAVGLVIARPPYRNTTDPFFGLLLAGIEIGARRAGPPARG